MTNPAAGATDEAARVRGYIIAQANKLALPDLVAKVRADCAPLREVGAAVPQARFNERPGPGDWSAAEVWTHVLRMSESSSAAITGILDEGKAPADRERDVMTGETRPGLTTSEDYWDAYIGVRERLYDRVLKANGDERPDLKITHITFADFTWREWFLFMRVHDLDHMRQLQAITQAFTG